MFRSAALLSKHVSHAPATFRLTERGLGFALGVWISLYPAVQLALHPRVGLSGAGDDAPTPLTTPLVSALLATIVLAGIAPAFLGAVTFGVDFRRARLLVISIFLFCICIPISLLFSGDAGVVSYVFLINYVLACMIVFVSMNLRGEIMMRAFFAGMGATLALVLAAVLVDHDYVYGRLVGRMTANYWGDLAWTLIVASMAIPRWLIKTPLLVLGAFVIYVAQSRSAMVALTSAILLAGLLVARRERHRMTWAWFLGAIGLLAVATFGSNFILNDLMKFSDPLRGLNSGLTGRTDTWRSAWDVFVSHPLFGVGYQQHEAYIENKMPVHNDYLATLADLGVIGLLGYLIFQFGGMCRAVARAWAQPTGINVAIAAYLFSFTIIGLLEPTGFHIGNTISMVMVFLSAWSWRVEPAVELAPRRRTSFMARAGVGSPSRPAQPGGAYSRSSQP
jgi:O-antigen ligase